MKGRLPEEILDRPKQAYRAPIRSTFISEDLPEYLKTMLTEQKIKDFGIFNPDHVKSLLTKMTKSGQVSEIDNMAVTAILSTQILHDLFVNKAMPELQENELVKLDKTIHD